MRLGLTQGANVGNDARIVNQGGAGISFGVLRFKPLLEGQTGRGTIGQIVRPLFQFGTCFLRTCMQASLLVARNANEGVARLQQLLCNGQAHAARTTRENIKMLRHVFFLLKRDATFENHPFCRNWVIQLQFTGMQQQAGSFG